VSFRPKQVLLFVDAIGSAHYCLSSTAMPTLRCYRIISQGDANGSGEGGRRLVRVEIEPPPSALGVPGAPPLPPPPPPPPPGVLQEEEEEVLPPMPPIPGREVPNEVPSASSLPLVSGDRAGPAPAAVLLPNPPSSTNRTAAAASTVKRRSKRLRRARRSTPPPYDERPQAASNAPSNGCGHCVGVANPTGNKDIKHWNLRYGELIEYKRTHGNCIVPGRYKSNKQLGSWVGNQRTQYRLLQQGKESSMTEERISKLEAIGFVWDASHLFLGIVDNEAWDQRYGELIEYKRRHGNCNAPTHYKPNKELGYWVHTQRRQYRLLKEGKYSTMTDERISKLEKIGFSWDASHLSPAQPNDDAWNQRHSELVEYKEKHGDCLVPYSYEPNKQLGRWVGRQRWQYRLLQQGKQSSMTGKRIAKLEEIGFKWKARG